MTGYVRVAPDVDVGDGDDSVDVGPYFVGTRLRGGPGRDRLAGGDGGDTIDGGPGADELSGGASTDTVFYEDRTAGVSVTLNGIADDGEEGEADSIAADFERLLGGAGDDRLDLTGRGRAVGADTMAVGNAGDDLVVGSDSYDRLAGGPGADELRGAAGGDLLYPGEGADSVYGGPDSDSASLSGSGGGVTVVRDSQTGAGHSDGGTFIAPDVEGVVGTPFNDVLIGSDGPDNFRGGGGYDLIRGLAGNDGISAGGEIEGGPGRDYLSVQSAGDRGIGTTVRGRDGEVDKIECGTVPMILKRDSFDDVDFCSRATRPGAVAVAPGSGVVGKGGRGRLKVYPGAASRGRLTIAVKDLLVLEREFWFKRGGLQMRRFRLNAAGRRLLKREGAARALVTFDGTYYAEKKFLYEYDDIRLTLRH
jgi:Ca2+-binding RTX toxin-like protein